MIVNASFIRELKTKYIHMKRAMRSVSHKGESKISVANNFLGEFHMATEK